jgi:hypothetical protein
MTTAATLPAHAARTHTVLVMEAQALGMIGVIRSLGRAGYCVHAASADADALGFVSRYTAASTHHPAYASPDFLPWLERYLGDHSIAAIVPSEGFLHAIAPIFERVRPLLPDANPSEVWQCCLSKIATTRHLLANAETSTHLPPGGVITDETSLPDRQTLVQLCAPFYLKADMCVAKTGQGAQVVCCPDPDSLLVAARRLLPDYPALLWQAHVPGEKVGVSLWRHDGVVQAENMVLSIHQRTHKVGMMSLRRTWWHERLLADAKQKLQALDWQGVAMMEYKWDAATDDFWFIEINARYWGYLHLDLFAGKDLPRLQLDGFFGQVQSDLGPARIACSCRDTWPGEWSYVLSRLRDPAVPITGKLRSLCGFALRFLHPTMKSDLLFPGDRALYWREFGRFLRGLMRPQ